MIKIEPITNRERFLAAVGGQQVSLPEPVTRAEQFLYAMTNSDYEPPAPLTREEFFMQDAIEYIRSHSGTVTHTVSYYNYDGSELLYSETVNDGDDAEGYEGDTPTKEETAQYTYSFVGWSAAAESTEADTGILENITADKSVYAAFEATEKTFTVMFYNDAELIYTASNVAYNGTAVFGGAEPTKESTAQYTYSFSGWNSDSSASTVDADALKNVTSNRSVYAIFSQTERTYTVSYYSQDGQTLIDTESVVYGGNASFSGTTPTKQSTAQYNYTFVGWNTSTGQTSATANILDNITADKSVYAAFSENTRTYTVYFYNESTLLQTVTGVEYGGTATYTEATPTKSGYTFDSWSPSNTNIVADTSCYAQFVEQADYITDSWDVISQRSAAGTASNYYAVGDCKPVVLNGTMGTLALDTTLYVYILGFNHNSTYEPNGITFGGFKTAATNGVDVALCDNYYNSTSTDGSKWFNQSHWGNYNYGGWKGSDMRYDILGSTNVQPSGYGSTPTTSKVGYDATSTCATTPVDHTLMSCLPSDLRAAMKPMTKYTDNKGNSSNTSGNVTSSIDYLPLLSEFEIQGNRTYANQYEQNKQAQYAYYSAGNSKVKYNHSAASSAVAWWARSPCYDDYFTFCLVTTNGYAADGSASLSRGVAPAFLI